MTDEMHAPPAAMNDSAPALSNAVIQPVPDGEDRAEWKARWDRAMKGPFSDIATALSRIDVAAITAERLGREAEITATKQALANATARLAELAAKIEARKSRVFDLEGAARRLLAGERVIEQPLHELEAERDGLVNEGLPGLRKLIRESEEDAGDQHPALDDVIGAANAMDDAMLSCARGNLPTAYADLFVLGRNLGAERLTWSAHNIGECLSDLVDLKVYDRVAGYEPSNDATIILDLLQPVLQAACKRGLGYRYAPKPTPRMNASPAFRQAA